MFQRRWDLLLGLVLTLALLWPLVVAPYFSHHDNVQTMRIYEMDQCFRDLQLPCRWVPDLGGGFGYPEFNYYAPLPYYVGELFYVASHDVIVAAKLTFAAAFVLPFLFTFLFASLLWGRLGGSLSAVFYVFAPYHAHNLYVRGAMGELWAMAAFPFVLWAFVRLGRRPTFWNGLLLGISVAILILCHNLSALLLLLVLAMLGAVHVLLTRDLAYIKHGLLAAAWAIGLSAFYLFPMLLENGYVHLETMTLNEYNYAEHFQGLRTVLLETPWWSPDRTPGVTYEVGTVHILAWVLGLVALGVCWRRLPSQTRAIVITFAAISVLSVYMIHPASQWIWDRVGPLSYLQFPWRLLSLIGVATSTLAGASLLLMRNPRARVALWGGLVALVAVVNVGWFKPVAFLNVTQADLLTDGGWDNLRMYAISDFLPKSAQDAPRSPSTSEYTLVSGQSAVGNVERGSDWVAFDADSQPGAEVQINKFDFPRWEVTVDGQPVAYGHDASSGLLQVALPAGPHHVEARLRDTPVRIFGNVLSAVALVLCAGVCLGWAVLRRRRVGVRQKELVPAAG